jgi:IAA-amino acid hydrolase
MHPLHSPYFVIDEDVLPVGAAFHSAVAMEYLNKYSTTRQTELLRIEL